MVKKWTVLIGVFGCITILIIIFIFNQFQEKDIFLSSKSLLTLETCEKYTSDEKEIIILEKSSEHYHSHHWYHIGQHFLSTKHNHKIIQHSHIQISPTHFEFIEQLSKIGFFILLLSLNFHNIIPTVIEVVGPYKVVNDNIGDTILLDHAINQKVLISPSNEIWIYNFSKPLQYRFMIKKQSYFSFLRFQSNQLPIECVEYNSVLKVGSKSAINSSFWMNDKSYTGDTIRKQIKLFCNGSEIFRKISNPRFFIYRNWYQNSSNNLRFENSHTHLQKKEKNQYKIVIYQRDQNRKWIDFKNMLKRITKAIHSRDELKSSIKMNNTIVMNKHMDNHIIDSLGDWRIEVMYHDEDADPCLLYEAFRDADIFLTTHGFQSLGK
jgi:hypothetical protein